MRRLVIQNEHAPFAGMDGVFQAGGGLDNDVRFGIGSTEENVAIIDCSKPCSNVQFAREKRKGAIGAEFGHQFTFLVADGSALLLNGLDGK